MKSRPWGGEMVSFNQRHVKYLVATASLPRHTANVCIEYWWSFVPFFAVVPSVFGDGVPLTNEVMDWGGEGCCQSVTHTVRHSLINWISLLNQRYLSMCVHQILVVVCAILRSRALCFAATVYLWRMKDGLSCILYTRGNSEGRVGRAVWCNDETEVVTFIRQSMWQHCGDQSTAYPM
jgi:hypothetical protein